MAAINRPVKLPNRKIVGLGRSGVRTALGANSPEAAELASLLDKIKADLAVEEALVAQMMKRHGL